MHDTSVYSHNCNYVLRIYYDCAIGTEGEGLAMERMGVGATGVK